MSPDQARWKKQQAAHLVPTTKTLAGYPLHEGYDFNHNLLPFFRCRHDVLTLFVEETLEIFSSTRFAAEKRPYLMNVLYFLLVSHGTKIPPHLVGSLIFIFSSIREVGGGWAWHEFQKKSNLFWKTCDIWVKPCHHFLSSLPRIYQSHEPFGPLLLGCRSFHLGGIGTLRKIFGTDIQNDAIFEWDKGNACSKPSSLLVSMLNLIFFTIFVKVSGCTLL